MVGETLNSSAPSSTSSSNNNPLPPTEDAWVNSYQCFLPQWQQSSSALPHQPAIPIAISRVNQVDAGRLDIEMSAMLKEQLVKVFSLMKPGMLFQYEPELDAFLEFLIWRFSIWVVKPTPGNVLVNLRYRYERAMENRGKELVWRDPDSLLLKRYGTVLPPFGVSISGPVYNHFLLSADGAILSRSMTRRAWYLIQRIEGFYKAASFSNLLIFLYTGRYCYYCLRTRCSAAPSFRCSRCNEPVIDLQRHGGSIDSVTKKQWHFKK